MAAGKRSGRREGGEEGMRHTKVYRSCSRYLEDREKRVCSCKPVRDG